MGDELDHLLRDARSDGLLDSGGGFSLDLFRAARKLGQFQLPDPYLYAVKLAQSAVAGGATRVGFRVDADELEVGYDGRTLTGSEIERLGDLLLARDRLPAARDRALGHLAVAVNAAVALEPQRIEVASGGVLASFSASGQDRQTWEGIGNLVRVTRRLGRRGFLRLAAGPRCPPEETWLRERLGLAPIPILLNRQLINRPYFGIPRLEGRFRFDRAELGAAEAGKWARQRAVPRETYLLACEYGSDLMAAPPEGDVLAGTEQRRRVLSSLPPEEGKPDPGPPASVPGLRLGGAQAESCYAMFARTRASWSEIGFVQDGALLGMERNLMDRPGLFGFVAAGHLATDLSGFGLIHDQAFHKTVNYLRDQVLWMY